MFQIIQKNQVRTITFLMLLTEQGFVGMIIFIWLTILSSCGKKLLSIPDKNDKNFMLTLIASMIIIYVQLMLSDLVEALKIGVFFFINLALIVRLDVKYKKD